MATFYSLVQGVRERLTPILKDNKCVETGLLTPDEFVTAGDQLVHTFPSWAWGVIEDESHVRSILPKDKQFLVTRSVSCPQRIWEGTNEMLINDVDGGEWTSADTKRRKEMAEYDIEDMNAIRNNNNNTINEAEQEIWDVQADEDEDMLIVDERSIRNMQRYYDIYLTYDMFYRTPRMWLMGYDEHGNPLTFNEIKQDIAAEQADKTITMESFPHKNISMPTIHPCKHSQVMKKMFAMDIGDSNDRAVRFYVPIFLKFMASIMPYIHYDNTMSISKQ